MFWLLVVCFWCFDVTCGVTTRPCASFTHYAMSLRQSCQTPVCSTYAHTSCSWWHKHAFIRVFAQNTPTYTKTHAHWDKEEMKSSNYLFPHFHTILFWVILPNTPLLLSLTHTRAHTFQWTLINKKALFLWPLALWLYNKWVYSLGNIIKRKRMGAACQTSGSV